MRVKVFFRGGRERVYDCNDFNFGSDILTIYEERPRKVKAEFYREALEGYETVDRETTE